MRTRLLRPAALGLIVLLASLAGAGVAWAHAAYESSDPPDGASVGSPPSRVTAKFTEPVVKESTLRVYDPCGGQVDNRDSLVAGDRITVTMSADKRGAYTVRFDVVSSVDGHPTRGKFGFTSTGGSACPGAEEQAAGDNGGDDPAGSGGAGRGRTKTDERPSGSRAINDEAAGRHITGDRQGANRNETKQGKAQTRNERPRASGSGDKDARLAQSDPAAATADGADGTGIWHGIPMGPFFVAMAIAALIGAAGGQIYADIMGSRR